MREHSRVPIGKTTALGFMKTKRASGGCDLLQLCSTLHCLTTPHPLTGTLPPKQAIRATQGFDL